jgi:hypothetical protein
MKKGFLLCLIAGIVSGAFAQHRPVMPSDKANFSQPARTYRSDGTIIGLSVPNRLVSQKSTLDDPVLMSTTYDLMTNSSAQNRIYWYPDGTVGAVSTMAHDNTSSFTDRGTGYNYYNGATWGPPPASRIENIRTGWPSYCPLGPAGELTICHQNATSPLVMNTRAVKGTGAWTQTFITAPSGSSGLDWPRAVTNGPDHTYIHLIAVTGPTGNGGTVYQGLDGAIVYNRSLDGGTTWDGWQLLDGMTSTEYLGFNGDAYAFAEPEGETLCFVVSDSWNDGFIMKSTDNGDTWEKTKFWSCQWNLWAGPDTTGTFYCPDGSSTVALDNNGVAHVVFGLQRARGDETGGKFWYPFTDGVIYWNENMPELPQDLNPDILYANGNYIGWVQDTMVWYAQVTELAYYYLSLSSMPGINIIDDDVWVVFSSVTTLRDPNSYMLRHLFMTRGKEYGTNWTEDFTDITGDFLYTWSECVYPVVSPTVDYEYLHLDFMRDDEAGIWFYGSQGAQGQTAIVNNDLVGLKVLLWNGIKGKTRADKIMVSGFYPNPSTGTAYVDITITSALNVGPSVVSATGQVVLKMPGGLLNAGTHQVPVTTESLTPGIYFCKITAGDQSIVRKLIVE